MKVSLLLSAMAIAALATGCSSKSETPQPVPQVRSAGGGGGEPTTGIQTASVDTGSGAGSSAAGATGHGLTIHLVGRTPDGSSPYAADSDRGIMAVSCTEMSTGHSELLKERFKHGADSLDVKVRFTYADKQYEVVKKELTYGSGPDIDAVEIESGTVISLSCGDTLLEI